MKDRVLIYEVHYSNFNRYVIPLAEYIIKNKLAKKVYLVYDNFLEHDKIQSNLIEGVYKKSIKQAFSEVKTLPNNNFVFINYSFRIPDLYWTYRLKKVGVKCYQYQHGMYAEFLERSFWGYFSSFRRKVTYFRYLIYFFFKLKLSIFLYLFNKDFIKSFRINEYIESRRSHKLKPILSDKVLVWGEYWKHWFIKNHYYSSMDSFLKIGNPDYHTFIKGKDLKYFEDKVCYIAQTFVEDGRMKRENYKSLIDTMSERLKNRLIIKLHPRSDKTLFEKVITNGGMLVYDFPITDYYIGHYSSLLVLALNQDKTVFLLEINNEKIPDYFIKSSNGVFNSVETLFGAIENKNIQESNESISYYFENIQDTPYSIINKNIF